MATPLRKEKKTGGDAPTEKHHSYCLILFILALLTALTYLIGILVNKIDLSFYIKNNINFFIGMVSGIPLGVGIIPAFERICTFVKNLIKD